MGAALLAFLLVACRYALCKETHVFDGEIVNLAVGIDKLFVLTDKPTQLHQMTLSLTLEMLKLISNSSANNMTLLPFTSNGTLLTCGSLPEDPCGYCEVIDLNHISTRIHRESSTIGSYSSIAFFTDHGNDKYLLVAKNRGTKCDSDALVTLRDTVDGQVGGIFSKSDHHFTASIQPIIHKEIKSGKEIKFEPEIQFVHGFQLNASNIQRIYLFMNVKNRFESKVKLLTLDNRNSKGETFKTLQGAALQCCDGNESWMLLSSALIPGESQVLWAGVFQDNTGDAAVAIFDISPSQTGPVSGFCFNKDECNEEDKRQSDLVKDKVLKPAAVVFKYSNITSVAALRSNSWIVLFFGTGTGLLIKLVVDASLKPGCPTVLYSSNEDQHILPRMLFTPVHHTDIYMALGNQMITVPVAQCGVYQTLRDCWSALDPFCGWCVSQNRCSFQHDCSSSDWVSVPGTSQQREIISVHMKRSINGQDITVTAAPNLNSGIHFACALEKCDSPGPSSCSCILSSESFPAEGLGLSVNITIQRETLIKDVRLENCSAIRGGPPSVLCMQCFFAGCVWSLSGDACTWRTASTTDNVTTQDVCRNLASGQNQTKPEILSMRPGEVSIHGRNGAVIQGRNLESVTKVRFQGNMDCNPKESPVLSHSGNSSSVESVMFHIPSGTKSTVRVCVLTPDGQCHGNAKLTYASQPTCRGLSPNTTWASGGREILFVGSNLEFVEKVKHSGSSEEITPEPGKLGYSTPPGLSDSPMPMQESVMLIVGNYSVTCKGKLTYHPDPHFTSFTTTRTGKDMSVVIQKTADSLVLKQEEISVQAMQGEKSYGCVIERIEPSADTTSVVCEISNQTGLSIDTLKITVGGSLSVSLKKSQNLSYIISIPIFIAVIICVVGVVVYWHRRKQRMLTNQMNKRLEMIECDIRKDIRQGFVDMQTDRSELISSTGAIPFLDYKHFASRIFFPEDGPLATSMMKDMTQLSVKEQQDQSCRALSHLIRDPLFLVSFVHTLEEQKNFIIKDKCMVASLLTLALHDDLPYLTQVMEQLLVSLMEQPSNAHPKLLLRRTESIVEKLLTNWMSVCLYGFLRECVGQPLYLLVCALTEQISKGPVDSVTGKALYTLSENDLLSQAQDFSPLKLSVLFAVGTEGEVSEPLDVCVLDCDTVEQVKEKILLTFHRKFGFRYTQQLHDIDIEFEQSGCYVALQEVDSSSEMMGEVTMLNTLKHYRIPDGSTIKVITRKVQVPKSPTLSFKEEPDFQTKYFHLIDPELADNKNSQGKKLKVKEVYLTKLLSTKVAVHSYVENLFKTIWGTSNNRPPHAVKYFFDFLDSQGENKNISDPDVLHIWKTNSLPLRFWVNILKNPQFVFDLEKTPLLDGCLSVIAQAFMDSFSLTEQQLGMHAPTNKLLYAKDIPQYKQEVKAYYKKVQEQPALSSREFKDFLQEESKKHENEFNESAALCEIYKLIHRYFNQIEEKLEQTTATSRLKEELQQVRELFDSKKKSSWE